MKVYYIEMRSDEMLGCNYCGGTIRKPPDWRKTSLEGIAFLSESPRQDYVIDMVACHKCVVKRFHDEGQKTLDYIQRIKGV